MLAWYNNKVVEESSVNLGLKTHGLHYATSVFEGVRVYNGNIFAALAHAERLIFSSEVAGIPFSYDATTLVDAMENLVQQTGLTNSYIRPIAWKGDESLGIYAPKNSVHVAIIIFEWPNVFNADAKNNGIAVTTDLPYRRPDPACTTSQAKASANYLCGVLNREAAARQGFDDGLMADYRGYVAEASGANVFFERDGQLFTPVPKGFLNGITRQVVMALAKEKNIAVHETDIGFDELESFEHIFLTGTAYEVMPVSRVDNRKYQVGGLTPVFQAAYRDLTFQKAEILSRNGYATIKRDLDLGS